MCWFTRSNGSGIWGFNIINDSSKIEVVQVPSTNKNLSKLEQSIFLLFTGHPRQPKQ